jgi:hypothetical protein
MKKFLARGSKKGDRKKNLDPPEDDAEEKDDDGFPQTTGYLMIFGGTEAYASKRQQKLVRREVYVAEPATPTYLKWSNSTITFNRSNHPEHVSQPGRCLLVVDPIVGTK